MFLNYIGISINKSQRLIKVKESKNEFNELSHSSSQTSGIDSI